MQCSNITEIHFSMPMQIIAMSLKCISVCTSSSQPFVVFCAFRKRCCLDERRKELPSCTAEPGWVGARVRESEGEGARVMREGEGKGEGGRERVRRWWGRERVRVREREGEGERVMREGEGERWEGRGWRGPGVCWHPCEYGAWGLRSVNFHSLLQTEQTAEERRKEHQSKLAKEMNMQAKVTAVPCPEWAVYLVELITVSL